MYEGRLLAFLEDILIDLGGLLDLLLHHVKVGKRGEGLDIVRVPFYYLLVLFGGLVEFLLYSVKEGEGETGVGVGRVAFYGDVKLCRGLFRFVEPDVIQRYARIYGRGLWVLL